MKGKRMATDDATGHLKPSEIKAIIRDTRKHLAILVKLGDSFKIDRNK